MRKVILGLCMTMFLAALPMTQDGSMRGFFISMLDRAYPFEQARSLITKEGLSEEMLEDWVEAILPWEEAGLIGTGKDGQEEEDPVTWPSELDEAVLDAAAISRENQFTGIPTDYYVTIQEKPQIDTSISSLKGLYNQELIQNYAKTVSLYNYDSESMRPSPEFINGEAFMQEDLSLNLQDLGDEPTVLIFHTHGHEGYIGKEEYGILDVGDYLEQILEENYGIQVLHHKGIYDEGGVNGAYTRMGEEIPQILAEHPSIQIAIDMHRDGVGENTRLVSNVDGREVAKVMLVTGVSRSFDENGDLQPIEYLPNENLHSVLSLGFQLKMAADTLYPGFMRQLYLSSWRYSTYMLPRSMLLEVGAQTNTLEEAKAAMIPFARTLVTVLSDQG
ncbi:MAG: hypothetical protein HFE64_07985 [Lachnospiraceae bacterium]|jgi:stage II sporulation protein P|nr:hypothetical protein [Lachnospiraceae bacterium]